MRLAFMALVFSVLLFPFDAGAAQAPRVSGTVRDQNGAPVRGARVRVEPGGAERVTGDDGRFELEAVAEDAAAVVVEAEGFAEARVSIVRATGGQDVDVTLAPASPSEEITVTAARAPARVGDTPASVTVLEREDLATTAAVTTDDALRQVPGFTLFRRTGSRAANPTTQGVSLRGVGASGASRALVLADGIPLNDPFGGWVYWGRVPRASLDRVEVVRGAASDLYGSDALGGVVNLITVQPGRPRLEFQLDGGNESTGDVSLSASGTEGPWGAALSAEGFTTKGYVLLRDEDRGSVDTPAGSDRATVDLLLTRELSSRASAFVRGSLYGERRTNGTPLQDNSTTIRQIAAGANASDDRLGAFSVRLYASTQDYAQAFSAVSADRNSETLTRTQQVPAQAFGGSLQWTHPFGEHTVVAGFDAREVRGASDEIVYFAGRPSSAVGAGGRERSGGAFGEAILRLGPRWIVTLAGRFDRWRELGGLSTTSPLGGSTAPVVVREFRDRTETAFSPRASVLFRATDSVSFSASAYRAFRAPTLNELYRSFRVGNVLTLANAELRAERLTGGEAGVRVALGTRFDVRGAGFWSEIVRPVANVTLDVTPDLITRVRRNLGRTRSAGVEAEAEARLGRGIVLSAGYLYTNATVRRFPADPTLEGLRIPQVPAHQFTLQGRYVSPRGFTASVQARASSEQFDDDRNRLPLESFFVLDGYGDYRLARGLRAFVAAENVFDTRYAVGRTPTETISAPALVRAGISVRIGE